MFKKWREMRRQAWFRAAFNKVSHEKFDSGEISYEEFVDCQRAVKNKEAMRRAYNQMIADPNMLGGLRDINWQRIYEWFVTYFIPAMRVILPIVLLLLDEEE